VPGKVFLVNFHQLCHDSIECNKAFADERALDSFSIGPGKPGDRTRGSVILLIN